jgi:hypothetical protein
MGLFKKLGLPNGDRLDESVRQSLTANPLKNNPLTAAKKASQLARAGKLGRIPIPGEINLMLRPGKLRLTYEQRGVWRTKIFNPPRPPGLEVRPVGGGDTLPLEWIEGGYNNMTSGFSNTTKALLAEVQIPGTSEYTISAPAPLPPAADGMAEHEDPHLLLDA